MLAYVPYMDPMGYNISKGVSSAKSFDIPRATGPDQYVYIYIYHETWWSRWILFN